MHNNNNIKNVISDKKKFEIIFKKYYQQLCAFAYNFMEDLQDAEEIVQDVFVDIWNNNKINIKISLKAYLYTSVKNKCLNKKKHILVREEYKEENKKNLEQSNFNTDQKIEASELERKIRNLIEKLPLKRQKIFILSRYNGLKYKEIAKKMNISVKTVENQMSSALKFLRKELVEYICILILIFIKF